MVLRRIPSSDRLLIAAMVPLVLLVAVLVWLLAPAERKDDPLLERPSTFLNDATGAKAAYLVLEQLGYRVERLRRRPQLASLEAYDGLVLLRPWVSFDAEDEQVVLQWVTSGGRLLVVPGSAHQIDWFGYVDGMEPEVMPVDSERAETAPPPRRLPHQSTQLADSPLTAGLERLETRSTTRFDPEQPLRNALADSAFKTVWSDEAGSLMLDIRHGQGRIIALADAFPLSNLGLDRADHDLLLGNIARVLVGGTSQTGTIGFDEYHLGFAKRDVTGVAIAKLIVDGDRGWAAVQAALVGLLALLTAAVRFGPAEQVEHRRRRSRLEFIQAAARLLEQAGGARLAWQALQRRLRRQICQAVHLPEQATPAALAHAVRTRVNIDLDQELAQEPDSAERLSSRQLLARTRKLQQALEKLEVGYANND